jgi:hypothetical protein
MKRTSLIVYEADIFKCSQQHTPAPAEVPVGSAP